MSDQAGGGPSSWRAPPHWPQGTGAACCEVAESVADPQKYFLNNVRGSLSLLEASRAGGIDKVVFSSSAAVYGVPAAVPITEESPRLPCNTYGLTKAVFEQARDQATFRPVIEAVVKHLRDLPPVHRALVLALLRAAQSLPKHR